VKEQASADLDGAQNWPDLPVEQPQADPQVGGCLLAGEQA